MCFPVIVSNVRQAAEGVALAVWASAGHVAPVTAEHTEAGSGAESGALKSSLACRAFFFLTLASAMAKKSSFLAIKEHAISGFLLGQSFLLLVVWAQGNSCPISGLVGQKSFAACGGKKTFNAHVHT